MRLTLAYPPSANRYWRMDRRGWMFVSSEGRRYKAAIFAIARAQLRAGEFRGEFPVYATAPVRLTLRVYRPRHRGDLDNRLKVLLDALKGVLFGDDEQVVHITADRFDDRPNPRVEVEFEAAEEMAA